MEANERFILGKENANNAPQKEVQKQEPIKQPDKTGINLSLTERERDLIIDSLAKDKQVNLYEEVMLIGKEKHEILSALIESRGEK